MPAVFVHGVPDTSHLWEPVRAHLSRKDILALDLPGFGSPLPEGFTSTKEEYVTWIIAQLEKVGEPVDLVGHDWGCLMTARVASLRPDLIRTWAAGGGPVSAEYEWHELAKIWQTRGVGEKFMAELDATKLEELMQGGSVPAERAEQAAARVDSTMKECILRLYRSAVTVGEEWEPDLADVTAPALVLWGSQDPVCPVRFADRLAASTHASRVLKLDASHWFPEAKPAEVAHALEEHWNTAQAR